LSFLARATAELSDLIARTGPAAPLVLFLGSFVEYVFPPFPGDLVVVLGAWYAVQGQLSWPAAFVAVTAGAVLGAWLDFQVGRSIGRRIDGRAARRGGLSAARLARFEAAYRRWGGWLLVVNRFMPGVRAIIFLAAGATGIPLRKVLVLGAVSAAAWNVVLLAAGALVAKNLDDLVELVDRYTRAASIALAVAAAAGVVVLLWRRRRARGAEEA
jgi:membrane protein DedA with SNARE-associated domain